MVTQKSGRLWRQFAQVEVDKFLERLHAHHVRDKVWRVAVAVYGQQVQMCLERSPVFGKVEQFHLKLLASFHSTPHARNGG